MGTYVLQQQIKRRVWLPRAICQAKQSLATAWAVIEAWLAKLGQRKTTTATRMPRIRTTTANRLTWFANHDSCADTAFARKAGTNSSRVGVAEAPTESDDAPCSCSRCFSSKALFSVSFFSQSRQSVLPSETGNPQDAHFCTRSMASGTEAVSSTGSGSGAKSTDGAGIAGGSARRTGGSARTTGGSTGRTVGSTKSGAVGMSMGIAET